MLDSQRQIPDVSRMCKQRTNGRFGETRRMAELSMLRAQANAARAIAAWAKVWFVRILLKKSAFDTRMLVLRTSRALPLLTPGLELVPTWPVCGGFGRLLRVGTVRW
ncbi:MAG: hypothetical protein WBH04_06540, partial [Albidovulum sp.]